MSIGMSAVEDLALLDSWKHSAELSCVRVCVCVSSNAMCGSLQCDTSAIDTLQRISFQASFESIVWRTINGELCTATSYISFYNGPDRPDPGFVPDGAACGTGKVGPNGYLARSIRA